MKYLSVQASNKSAANSPVKPSAPEGPARMVLSVPDEPARGPKAVLRDELGAVVTIHRYPPERLLKYLCLLIGAICLFLGCECDGDSEFYQPPDKDAESLVDGEVAPGLDGSDGDIDTQPDAAQHDATTDTLQPTEDAQVEAGLQDAEGIDACAYLTLDAGQDAQQQSDSSTATSDWSCHLSYYQDGVCDCGCAIDDPDCGNNGCISPGCNATGCESCFDESGSAIACGQQPQWTCESDKFDDGSQCDCGCGMADPDCNGEGCTVSGCTTSDCDRCHDDAGTSEISCDLDPTWVCAPDAYGSGDGCDCGCGFADPDCGGDGCGELPCDDSECDRCYTAMGRPIACGVPLTWQCDPRRYDTDDGCDCGCGAIDPDCGGGGCADRECYDSACSRCLNDDFDLTGCAVHIDWYCSDSAYGTGDGCDCNCGADDPDCASPADCDFCHDAGGLYQPCGDWICDNAYFGDGDCDCGCGGVDPDCGGTPSCTDSGCQLPTCDYCNDGSVRSADCGDAWMCDALYYNADDGCDCGCGAIDPDCNGDGCAEDGCIDAACETCYDADENIVSCAKWICDSSLYDSDGACDCGCGSPDPDCEGQGCGAFGCGAPGCDVCHDILGRIAPCPAWLCSPIIYADGSCDCGCDARDPDCAGDGCTVYPCPDDSACAYCYDAMGDITPCDGWSCPTEAFTDERCDCGCTRRDPGCAGAGCTQPGCEADVCDVCVSDNDERFDCNWRCDPSIFDANDGCDCGCGVIDPDCNAEGSCEEPNCFAESCDSCHDDSGETLDECGPLHCDPEIIGAGDGCDCGCGGRDPDCAEDEGCVAPDCAADGCNRCYNADGNAVPCWTCEPGLRTDGDCDCGCGAQDPACCGRRSCTEPNCAESGCQVCHDEDGDETGCQG